MAKPNLLNDVKPTSSPTQTSPSVAPQTNQTNRESGDWKPKDPLNQRNIPGGISQFYSDKELQEETDNSSVWKPKDPLKQRSIPSEILPFYSDKELQQENDNSEVWSPTDPLKQKQTNQGAEIAQSSAEKTSANPAVVKMQQAIINFGKLVSSDIPVQQPNASSVEQNEGAHSWLDFLVKAYANNATTVGKQLANTNVKQPTRMDTAKQNDKFRGMIDSLMRIGKHDNEQVPDGSWGPRTTNALRQIYAFAYGIVGIQRDMGISSTYGDTDLSDLYKNIPQQDTPKDVLGAPILSKNIEKLSNGYIDFKDKILHNPQYKGFIAQDKPLVSMQNKEQPMNSQEQLLMQSYANSGLHTTINKTEVMITPQDLVNIGAFKNFLSRVGPNIGIPQAQLQEALTSNQGEIVSLLEEAMQGLNNMQGAQ